MENTSRRDWLKLASLAFVGTAAADPQAQPAGRSMAERPFTGKENVRLGVIGTGGRGSGLVENFAAVPGVTIRALCDVVKEKVLRVQTRLDKAGKASQPIGLYTDGDHAYEQLVKRDDLDLVVIATPWIWHTPMAV